MNIGTLDGYISKKKIRYSVFNFRVCSKYSENNM